MRSIPLRAPILVLAASLLLPAGDPAPTQAEAPLPRSLLDPLAAVVPATRAARVWPQEERQDQALEYLVRCQHPLSGLWHAPGTSRVPGGFGAGSERDADLLISAVAMLAFCNSGYDHRTGIYRRTIDRGLRALLDHQREDGRWSDDLAVNAAVASAILELYGMTRDQALADVAARATQRVREDRMVGADGGRAWPARAGDRRADLVSTTWSLDVMYGASGADLLPANHYAVMTSEVGGWIQSQWIDLSSRSGTAAPAGDRLPALLIAAMRCWPADSTTAAAMVRALAERPRSALGIQERWLAMSGMTWHAMHVVRPEVEAWITAEAERLTAGQDDGEDRATRGSWPVRTGDALSERGGRVLTTAFLRSAVQRWRMLEYVRARSPAGANAP